MGKYLRGGVSSVGGLSYVYRGDITSEDFNAGDLTADDSWRTLDLSGIIPSGATLAHIMCTIDPSNAENERIGFAHGDADSSYVVDNAARAVGGAAGSAGLLVPLNSSRQIKYNLTSGSYSVIRISVIGWFI